jgi:hypothetical protein
MMRGLWLHGPDADLSKAAAIYFSSEGTVIFVGT